MKVLLLLGLALVAICSATKHNRMWGRQRNAREIFNHDLGPSLGYRPPPPLVRRDVISHVKYDPEKWISEADMTIAGATMFDRTSGLSSKECLQKCETFQDPKSKWICRSLTFDHKWRICDLFAIDGSAPPYFLTEYKHRDYFKYLAAVPPSDADIHSSGSAERSAELVTEEATTAAASTTEGTTTGSSTAAETSTAAESTTTVTTPPPSTATNVLETFPAEPWTAGPVLVTASERKHEESSVERNSNIDLNAEPHGLPELQPFAVDSKEQKHFDAELIKALAAKQTGDQTPNPAPTSGGLAPEMTVEGATEVKEPKAPTPPPVPEEEPVSADTNVQPERKPSLTVKIHPIRKPHRPEPPIDPIEAEIVGVPVDSATNDDDQPTAPSGHPVVPSSSESPKAAESSSIGESLATLSAQQPTNEEISIDFDSNTESAPTTAATAKPAFVQEAQQDAAKPQKHQKSKKKQHATKEPAATNIFTPNSVAEYNAAENCGNDEITRFVELHGVGRSANAEKKTKAVGVTECMELCSSEKAFDCLSATFASGECFLYASAVNHTDAAAIELTDADSMVYVERHCLPRKVAASTQLTYPARRNQILVGFVQEVTDAPTLKKCVADCAEAMSRYGFRCHSAMWYPTDKDQNCLLNSEDRHTKPDSFVDEDAGVVMFYVELGAAEGAERQNSFGGLYLNRQRDNPVRRDSRWTHWSSCREEDPNAQRFRYLKCTEKKDIRKCPKQSVMCKQTQTLRVRKLDAKVDEDSECRAIRDSRGLKKCPHGMRMAADGVRHYCVHPIDC